MTIDDAFLAGVEQARRVCQPGDQVVLGVSGGADSLTLLHLFHRHQRTHRLSPHVVHINHGLRGPAAASDAAFVAAVCAELGISYRVLTMDVPALVEEFGYSVEEAGRRARYTAFAQEAQRSGAKAVMVAHQADDQAETVLLRLVRGAGLRGLSGMQVVSKLSEEHLINPQPVGDTLIIVRPLLKVSRGEIEAYCSAYHLEPRQDATNRDPVYTRNRIRHVVMPFLETINPNAAATLARTAEILQADADFIEIQAKDAIERLRVGGSAHTIRLELEGWRALPLALQRATLRRAALGLLQVELGYKTLEEARLIALTGETNTQADLAGGVSLVLEHDTLVLRFEDEEPLPPTLPLLDPTRIIAMPLPGTVTLPGSTWRMVVEPYTGPTTGPEWQRILEHPWQAVFDAAALQAPLLLRTREPGDRFRPQGVGGSQKVSDFYANQKVALRLRDMMPLLLSAGRIAWVCGYRVDERFVVRPTSEAVWLARFEQSRPA